MSELRGETSRDNQPANQDTDNNTVTNQTRSSQAERKRSLRRVFEFYFFGAKIRGSKFRLKIWGKIYGWFENGKKIKYRNQFGAT